MGGQVLWQRELALQQDPVRVDARGTVWAGERQPDGQAFHQLAADGSSSQTIPVWHEPHEHAGSYVVLPDGFCVAWLPAESRRGYPPERVPRVARYTAEGELLWSTRTPVGRISRGLTGGLALPTAMVVSVDPLLVSGDRVLAHFRDFNGYVGVCFFLDLASGALVAILQPAAYRNKAIAGPGEFLIGAAGREFTTTCYGRDGRARRSWPCYGAVRVDQSGRICGPARGMFCELTADGTVREGPVLRGTYGADAAVSLDGTTVVWAGSGRLLAVDRDFQVRELGTVGASRRSGARVLLPGDGLAVLGVDSDLVLVEGTGLGSLDPGPWPCRGGNLGGNPLACADTE